MSDFPLHIDAVSLECFQRGQELLVVLARWTGNGPDGMAGRKAAEITFQLKAGANRVIIVTEPGIEADQEFAEAVCRVYGVYEAQAAWVDVQNIASLGHVRVR